MLRCGTFADRVIVHEACAVKMPDELPAEQACLIACGFSTGAGAALWATPVQEGSSVAVIGCGGVGLAVIQGARLAGAARIVAVDVLPEKLALAAELGATDTVDGSSGDAVAQVRELTDGVDYAFSAITAPAGLVDAVRMCAYAGTATLVGVPPPGRTLDIDLELDLFHPKVAIAVTHGGDTIPQEDFPFLAQAALDGRLDLDRFVTKTISLDEVPDALDELHAPTGRPNGRAALALAEGRAPLGVVRVDEMAVALDVAVLAADDEDDRVFVERIRELARRRRLAVEEAAFAELAASRRRPRRAPCRDGRSTARPACRGSGGSRRSRAGRRAR